MLEIKPSDLDELLEMRAVLIYEESETFRTVIHMTPRKGLVFRKALDRWYELSDRINEIGEKICGPDHARQMRITTNVIARHHQLPARRKTKENKDQGELISDDRFKDAA